MLCWEPEGRYCHCLCTAIAPFWLSTYDMTNEKHLLIIVYWKEVKELWGNYWDCQDMYTLRTCRHLRTRRALLLYKVYGNNALLALNWRCKNIVMSESVALRIAAPRWLLNTPPLTVWPDGEWADSTGKRTDLNIWTVAVDPCPCSQGKGTVFGDQGIVAQVSVPQIMIITNVRALILIDHAKL